VGLALLWRLAQVRDFFYWPAIRVPRAPEFGGSKKATTVSHLGASSFQTGAQPRSLIGLGTVPVLSVLTGTLLAFAFVFGGGTTQGLWSDALVDLASLGLLATLVVLASKHREFALPLHAFVLVGAIFLLPLLQLIPMPPSWWKQLPERALIAEAYRQAALPLPWLPISVDPAATWRSFLSLLPPIAVFFATIFLGYRARRSLSLVVIVVALASVFLGFAQVMQGPTSPLRFFSYTHTANSDGFFANRNHFAAFLNGVVPLTGAWIVGAIAADSRGRIFGFTLGAIILAVLLLGIGMAGSRAGLSLTLGSALASVLLVAVGAAGVPKGKLAVAAVVAAIVIGGVLLANYAFANLLDRFATDPLADYRFQIAQATIAAAKALQPVGAGFGTFVPVYQIFEDPTALIPNYVNRAHDDWLEIWLEGGYAALTVVALFLVWFVASSVRAWRGRLARSEAAIDQALPRAASVVIALLLLHSIVDYPLRTTALSTLLAFCCSILVPPVRLALSQQYKGGATSKKTRAKRAGFVSRLRPRILV
jgi:O-antigen ligase